MPSTLPSSLELTRISISFEIRSTHADKQITAKESIAKTQNTHIQSADNYPRFPILADLAWGDEDLASLAFLDALEDDALGLALGLLVGGPGGLRA